MWGTEPHRDPWKRQRRSISSTIDNSSTKRQISANLKQTQILHQKKMYKEMWREKWNATQPNKLSEIIDNIYTLPNILCENRHWDRCLARLRIGHSKLTHWHYMSREQAPIYEDCGKDTPLKIKHILTQCPLLNNRRRQFFDSINKTMKQLHNDGDTSYCGTLHNSFTSLNRLTRL